VGFEGMQGSRAQLKEFSKLRAIWVLLAQLRCRSDLCLGHLDDMRDFRKLFVWQKAHRLALDVQRAVESVPTRGNASLKSQTSRAAASIPANIAEGCGKSSDAEMVRYAEIVLGSTTELDNHLLFARDSGILGIATYAELEPRVAEVRRMLFGFVRAVRARSS
jgi:four helix bundle protein